MICEWSEIYEEFKELYPELWRKGTSYSPYGYMTIEIRIPAVGKFSYDYRDGRLECLEKWVDEKEVRSREKEQRPVMYDKFCRIVETYLYENDITHQQFANKVGISRQTLSKYLNGNATPKVSTMRRICETISINL